MSDFNDAIPVVLRHEGGFVDNPNDPGGATDFGISLRWLQSKGLLAELEAEDKTQDEVMAIRSMTKEQAMGYYKAYFWDPPKYQNLNAQSIATKLFDSAVNMGASRAHKLLQGCLGLPQDGILGPKTFAEANAMSPSVLVVKYQTAQAQFYRDLVAKNPKLEEFLTGWLNRAYDRN